MLRDQVAQGAHLLRALGGGQAGPGREGGFGGGDGGVDFIRATGGHFGQHALRGGVHCLEVVGAGDGLAVDEVINLLHGGSRDQGKGVKYAEDAEISQRTQKNPNKSFESSASSA